MALGYNEQVNGGLDSAIVTKIDDTLNDAQEYNDVFLLKTAYSMFVQAADKNLQKVDRALVQIYDHVRNTANPTDPSDDTFYHVDTTYTREMPKKILNIIKKLREMQRDLMIKYTFEA